MKIQPSRCRLSLILFALPILILPAWVASQPANARERLAGSGGPSRLDAPAAEWVLQGRVYEGDVGQEPPAAPALAGVTVCAYGSANPYPDGGRQLRCTVTDAAGWYGLPVYDDDGAFAYYHIGETDPPGYISAGATSVGGMARDPNWIEYTAPLTSKTLTGNKFWDKRPATPVGASFRYIVDPNVRPRGGPLPPIGNRPPRPLAAVMGPDGQDNYAVGEVILYTEQPAVLADFLARYHGEVLLGEPLPAPPPGLPADRVRHAYDHTHFSLLRVDLSRADLSNYVAWMEELGFAGTYVFSSEDAVRLSAIIAKERVVNHLEVSPDMAVYADSPDCVLCQTHERSLGGNLYEDAFSFPWYNDAGLQVSRAWQYFDLLHVSRTPMLAMIDAGFSLNADFPSSGISMYDFVEGDYDALGKSGGWHGTGTTSTAAAILDNQFGAAGTGGQAALPMLFRISDSGTGSIAVVAWALNTAVYWGADAVNMSIGSSCSSWCNWSSGVKAIDSATVAANQAGVVMVASAGNEETDLTTTYEMPCECAFVICVGAIDTTTKQAVRTSTHGWGSNYGSPGVDIWAPGDQISVTSNPESGGSLVWFNGTSAASPYVAGIVALMKAIQPGINASSALGALRQTANSSTDTRVSQGYINAYKALKQVASNAGVQPQGDKYEPNDTESTAYKIAGSSATFRATIAPGDLDYFVVDLTDYMDAVVAVHYYDGRTTGNELTAALDGIAGTQSGLTIFVTAQGLEPGKHYILVKGTTADSMNCYQLDLTLTSATITPDAYDDQKPAGEPRNDTFANRAVIANANLAAKGIIPVVELADLNFDTSSDIDYFEVTIPPETDPKTGQAECITPPANNPKFVQGYLELEVLPDVWKPQYPGNNWPFVVRADDASGVEFTSYKSKSGMGLIVECPHQYAAFSSDKVRFSVASKGGRRNYYRVRVYLNRWFDYTELSVPGWVWTLTQPPKIRIIPQAGWLWHVFPWDYEIIDGYFAGTITDPLPAGYAVFSWERAAALDLFLETQGGRRMALTLYGANQEVLGRTEVGGGDVLGRANALEPGHIHVPDLPTGTYVLAAQGDFATDFGLILNAPPKVYLPLLVRSH